jgi:hypothetical protein
MNLQQSVPNVGTSAAPAFCVFNGKPYLAFKGESDQTLSWTSASSLTPGSNGQYDWAPGVQIPNVASSDGPALASFRGSLYMAWKGEGTDTAIYLSKFDGKSWTPQQKLAAGTDMAPALVATSSYLMLAWKGQGDNTAVWFFTSTNGDTWTTQQQIGASVGGTSATPALTAKGDEVYMAWKALSGDDRLFWSKYAGSSWSAQQLITSGTTIGPAILCDNNNVIWLAWQAVAGGAIYYCSLENESNNSWSGQVRRYIVATSNRPAMISTGGGAAGIMLAFKGESSSNIWYASLLLPVPDSLTLQMPRTNAGQGTPASMAIEATLVLKNTGACTFTGTFFSENSFPEGSETWYITTMVKDGSGLGYCFSTSGTTGEGDTTPWSLNTTSLAVAQNWSGIVMNTVPAGGSSGNIPYAKAGDSNNWLSDFGTLLKDAGTVAEDVVEVIGIVAGALAGTGQTSDPSAAGGDGGG